MVFKILDASAFYSGVPFASSEKFFATSLVFDEIKHIKKHHDALGLLIETKRLEIKDPEKKFIENTTKISKKTGDLSKLSKEDISSLALSLQLKADLVTDDFAVSNVARNLGIKVIPIMTSGIKKIGKWAYYCVGCSKNFSGVLECPLCGNKLKRKLIKSQSVSN